MRIESEKLFRLSVVTEDGRRLGHVFALTIDVDLHSIVSYRVCPDQCFKNWLHRAVRQEIDVAASQVVAITATEIVVKSGVVLSASSTNPRTPHAIANAPVPLSTVTPTSSSAS